MVFLSDVFGCLIVVEFGDEEIVGVLIFGQSVLGLIVFDDFIQRVERLGFDFILPDLVGDLFVSQLLVDVLDLVRVRRGLLLVVV